MHSAHDLWCLGVLVYQLCTSGEPPFSGDTIPRLYSSICSKDYPAIPDCYSSNLSKFIDSLLRKNAKNRPTLGTFGLRQSLS